MYSGKLRVCMFGILNPPYHKKKIVDFSYAVSRPCFQMCAVKNPVSQASGNSNF